MQTNVFTAMWILRIPSIQDVTIIVTWGMALLNKGHGPTFPFFKRTLYIWAMYVKKWFSTRNL